MAKVASEEVRLQRKEMILKQRQSKLSIVSWCLENKIAVPTFYYWRNKLFPKLLINRNAFTEVSQGNDGIISGVSVECQGFKVHLERHFDPFVLKACLDVLKRC